MSAQVSARRPPIGSTVTPGKKGLSLGWLVLGLVLLIAGGGFWYYFFGKKPRVILTVTLPASAEESADSRGGWALGNRELLLLANDELKLVDLKNRAVKWTTKVPAAPAVDPERRAALNARFVRLQQWADELNQKRASLKTSQDTKAFNAEAAKYQAELVASRAAVAEATAPATGDAAKGKPTAASTIPEKAAAVLEKKPAPAEGVAGLKPIVTPEMQLLEGRIKRRAAQIAKLTTTVKTKKAAAKTEIQLSAAADDERRLSSLATEQKDEEAQLAQLQGKPKPVVAAPEITEPEPEEGMDLGEFFVSPANPFAAAIESQVWLIDSEHMMSFDRETGGIKSDAPLAGPVLKAWAQHGEIYVVASAGPEARQITRITASTGAVSLYVPAGKVDDQFQDGPHEDRMARIEKHRTEFTGTLLRADIRLAERKVTTRDAIKPESEKELTDAVNNAAAHSSEELLAAMKLLQNDGKRLVGATKTYADESIYQVTLSRPLDKAIPEWKGTVTGRVELHSGTSCDLVAAGTKLLAFDRSNRKLWEASMGAPLPPQDAEDSEARTCLEVGNRLYFADGAFLTAFETASGKVLWRLPSIGIRKLQTDADGKLYVHSLNLPTEALSGTFDDVSGEVHPLTMKVDPESGKIEWQEEKYEDVWVSGGDVYALREGLRPEDIENQVFDPGKMPPARVKLYKLNRSTGQPSWEWYQPRRPRSVHADRKTVGLLFDEELQVLHSIAL